ncbi:MAG: hypothetical protein HFH68_15810, partial [Lachnospiraceae bacterium]|nr:hypothetical protein [Lachnospiraceae bacterium]
CLTIITISHKKNAKTAFFITICAVQSTAWGFLCKCYNVPWKDYVKNNTAGQFTDDVKAVFSKTKSQELREWLYGRKKNEENTAAVAVYQVVI